MTSLKTLSEEKPFDFKKVEGGEIIVYPSDRDNRPQRKQALVVTPYVIESVTKRIQESGRVVMGASRDQPPPGSLGALLKEQGLPPQILSYLGSILVAEGSSEYVKEGKRVIMVALR